MYIIFFQDEYSLVIKAVSDHMQSSTEKNTTISRPLIGSGGCAFKPSVLWTCRICNWPKCALIETLVYIWFCLCVILIFAYILLFKIIYWLPAKQSPLYNYQRRYIIKVKTAYRLITLNRCTLHALIFYIQTSIIKYSFFNISKFKICLLHLLIQNLYTHVPHGCCYHFIFCFSGFLAVLFVFNLSFWNVALPYMCVCCSFFSIYIRTYWV